MPSLKDVKIAEPKWFEEAIKVFETHGNMLLKHDLPESIVGWMTVVVCRRMLRCIYGSDLAALEHLAEWLNEEIEREKYPVITSVTKVANA